MPHFSYELTLEGQVELRLPEGSPKEVFLLLHGYGLTGRFMYERIQPLLPLDALVIAPNAPLYIPIKKAKGWDLGFSWYIWDEVNRIQYVAEEVGLKYVDDVLREFSEQSLPLTIIGYSQGGYIAPQVGLRHKNTKRVIGINCRFRSETIGDAPLPFVVDALHGAEDEVVDPARSIACYAELNKSEGEFRLIPNTNHFLQKELLHELKQIL